MTPTIVTDFWFVAKFVRKMFAKEISLLCDGLQPSLKLNFLVMEILIRCKKIMLLLRFLMIELQPQWIDLFDHIYRQCEVVGIVYENNLYMTCLSNYHHHVLTRATIARTGHSRNVSIYTNVFMQKLCLCYHLFARVRDIVENE